MKIVVLDGYGLNPGDLSWNDFEQIGQLTVYDRTPADKVVERAQGAQAVITNKTPITDADMEALPDMKYIGVLATGYNIVDTAAAARRGIAVSNIPAYSTMSVAQMVFSLLLAITNRVEHYTDQNRHGRWASNPDFCYWDHPLIELAGKRMGIVGFGNTGSATARIALALGMTPVVYTSKSSLPERMEKATDLDSLFAGCDVVSLHCPLTDTTRHMVDARRLRLMKRSAILINTGRGPLVDEEALALALDDETIYAAGLDVLASEPPRKDNPLLTARNCFITPHIAWATFEARQRLMAIAADNLRAFIAGKPQNLV